ncbi:Protein of unknown function [Gryllus bimaculatus]|nr:Protein of unknown function [Gryllus bimaculatus]
MDEINILSESVIKEENVKQEPDDDPEEEPYNFTEGDEHCPLKGEMKMEDDEERTPKRAKLCTADWVEVERRWPYAKVCEKRQPNRRLTDAVSDAVGRPSGRRLAEKLAGHSSTAARRKLPLSSFLALADEQDTSCSAEGATADAVNSPTYGETRRRMRPVAVVNRPCVPSSLYGPNTPKSSESVIMASSPAQTVSSGGPSVEPWLHTREHVMANVTTITRLDDGSDSEQEPEKAPSEESSTGEGQVPLNAESQEPCVIPKKIFRAPNKAAKTSATFPISNRLSSLPVDPPGTKQARGNRGRRDRKSPKPQIIPITSQNQKQICPDRKNSQLGVSISKKLLFTAQAASPAILEATAKKLSTRTSTHMH